MSSGRTHDRITLWTLPLVVTLAFRVTLDTWLTVVVCLGFLLGGWVFGPDLDIHSVQYKRWGWLRWIWLPYRGSMRHRSRWSHGPIIGTMVRVLYASLWLALAGILVVDVLNNLERTALTWDDLVHGVGWSLRTYWPFWLALLVGLELGALSHYTADWLSSTWKRGRRGKRRSPTKGRRAQPPKGRSRARF
ncbi:MAG TPA: metal-binding protein [Leptolyngbyaceae cyanobacterium M65_K2018_010]|nr:metal-binding protein [Leptolyngbyaceae cyanobacterium M65_K2018_010]